MSLPDLSHNSSSMVFNIVLKLPQHPRFKGLCFGQIALTRLRLDLDVAASTAGPMDSVLTVWSVFTWLHDTSAYLVSCFDFLRLIDLYNFNLNPAASTPQSIDPIATFRWQFGWLHGLGMSTVRSSCGRVDGGVQQPHTNVSSHLEVAAYVFDSSASTARPNKSIQMICMVDGWLGQHNQQCCFDSFRVNVATASHAVHAATSSVVTAVTLNTRHNRLVSALNLSERNCLAQCLNRVRHHNFVCISHSCVLRNALAIRAYAQGVRRVPTPI
ncbi:hypothetical protein SCLCIDRAFT_21270 [Scleroderma citrinum Foug A]|uniref:Uncharacterized protein n=1 Tax=Scleroderma citrinum Foug A TaxID=1036808 RepID=A0A0C3AR22_9AGAM|nr:hypothetical protein SCLCIDRAFT_21270 [Scleroderma citrinum Foug A]